MDSKYNRSELEISFSLMKLLLLQHLQKFYDYSIFVQFTSQ